jgi:CHAD domain-containing protein
LPLAQTLETESDVKARRIDLSDAWGVDDAMRRIAIVRFAEVLTLVPSMRHGRGTDLHDLRIACKRLRYALERFTSREPALLDAASRLAQLQDVLGDIHDRDVLLGIMPRELHAASVRVRTEREDALARARALWRDGFAQYGPFEGLVRFTGLGYGFGDGEAN